MTEEAGYGMYEVGPIMAYYEVRSVTTHYEVRPVTVHYEVRPVTAHVRAIGGINSHGPVAYHDIAYLVEKIDGDPGTALAIRTRGTY